jgi:hypothetical protein
MTPGPLRPREKACVALGFNLGNGTLKQFQFAQGLWALLAQEVRSPFAGKFVLTVHACGGSSSREFYESVFLKHFACRLVFYQYASPAKKLAERRELASIVFQPKFAEPGKPTFEKFALEKLFENPTPGANHSFGAGLGVAVYVEKTTPGTLELKFDRDPPQAYVLIDRIELLFAGKERNEKVTV